MKNEIFHMQVCTYVQTCYAQKTAQKGEKMVSILEYDKEWEEKKLRKAEYEAGVAEGELKKARETALSLAEMGLPVDKIAEAVKISRDKVEEWMKESMSIV